MISGHQRDSLIVVKSTPQKGDRNICFEQGMGGKGPQGTDRFRSDGLKLPDQERFTGFNLLRFGIPVAGWPAFQDVADVNILSLQPHGNDYPRQQLPCFTDKRPSLHIFVCSGRFADKDKAGMTISLTEDKVCSRFA